MRSGSPSGVRPLRLAVARDRPALEAGRVQLAEDPGAALDEGLDLELLLPHGHVAQVRGQAGLEQVDRLEEVPVGRDDEVLLRHRCDLPCDVRRRSLASGNVLLRLRERRWRG